MYEIHKILVVSTAHISEETNNILENDLNVGFTTYGHFLWNFLHNRAEQDEIILEEWPEEIGDIFKLARKRNCAYILIDSDGPIYEELKEYDW